MSGSPNSITSSLSSAVSSAASANTLTLTLAPSAPSASISSVASASKVPNAPSKVDETRPAEPTHSSNETTDANAEGENDTASEPNQAPAKTAAELEAERQAKATKSQTIEIDNKLIQSIRGILKSHAQRNPSFTISGGQEDSIFQAITKQVREFNKKHEGKTPTRADFDQLAKDIHGEFTKRGFNGVAGVRILSRSGDQAVLGGYTNPNAEQQSMPNNTGPSQPESARPAPGATPHAEQKTGPQPEANNTHSNQEESQQAPSSTSNLDNLKADADTLGMNQNDMTDPSAINKAFRKSAMKAHPDKAAKNGMTPEEAAEKMKDLGNARDRLMENANSPNPIKPPESAHASPESGAASGSSAGPGTMPSPPASSKPGPGMKAGQSVNANPPEPKGPDFGPGMAA